MQFCFFWCTLKFRFGRDFSGKFEEKSRKLPDISRNFPKKKRKSCRNLEKKLPDFFYRVKFYFNVKSSVLTRVKFCNSSCLELEKNLKKLFFNWKMIVWNFLIPKNILRKIRIFFWFHRLQNIKSWHQTQKVFFSFKIDGCTPNFQGIRIFIGIFVVIDFLKIWKKYIATKIIDYLLFF
jgi:hypothetical protein